jgi:colicin import membrane protein
MATAALELVQDTSATTDIAVVVSQNPGVVLVDTAKFDAFYEKLKADADTLPIDLTTKKGRDAIASYAAKVRSEKAAIDKDRLRLTKEWRDLTAQVNGAWKGIEERLNGLAADVRAPLTEWEEAEKARVAECEAIINRIALAGVVTIDDTSATVRDRGAEIWAIEIDEERFGSLFEQASKAKAHAVDMLKVSLARLTKEEADRAELERLRAEAAEREEADRRADEAAAREAREAEDARVAEERRVEAEQAEAERLAKIEREAAENARREVERAAEVERQRVEREHAEQLAAEQRRADEAERVAKAERDRIAAEEAERLAKAEKEAAEQRQRDEDKAHRTAVKSAAKQALMTFGADEETARKIVVGIMAGEVPNVTLRF